MTAEPPAKRIVHEEDQDRLRSLWFNIYVPEWAPAGHVTSQPSHYPRSRQAYVLGSLPPWVSSRPTRSTAPYPLRAHLSLPYMPILRRAGATLRMHSCGSQSPVGGRRPRAHATRFRTLEDLRAPHGWGIVSASGIEPKATPRKTLYTTDLDLMWRLNHQPKG